MVEGGCSFSLALKTAERLRILSHIVGKELEGNKAAQLYIFRLIGDAHPPAAEFLDDALVRDGLSDHSG